MTTNLLAEDSRFLRLANERARVRTRYRAATAADGEEVLGLARASVPDLILLDMVLPKEGGPAVLRALRTTRLTAQVPVVVLSSLAKRNGARLKKDGATAYIDKSLHEKVVEEGDADCPVLDLQTLPEDNEI